jgi:hypothetical protein
MQIALSGPVPNCKRADLTRPSRHLLPATDVSTGGFWSFQHFAPPPILDQLRPEFSATPKTTHASLPNIYLDQITGPIPAKRLRKDIIVVGSKVDIIL